MFNALKTRDALVKWITDTVTGAGCRGLVFGLSGGVDSAVVAGLCKIAYPETTLGVIMPCYSDPTDKKDALLVKKALQFETMFVDLAKPFDYLLSQTGIPQDSMAAHNLKPRLRSSTLGLIAQSLGYLVIGGSNLAEWHTGYFTKFGDSAVDLLPLARLTKTEVWELARLLNIPEKIIKKTPSAGLWQGQTDEEELGIPYAKIDAYLLGESIDTTNFLKLEKLHKKSAHKRQMPPIGPVIRDPIVNS